MQEIQQGQGCPQVCQQGNMQGMQQGPAWFGAQWIPQQQQQQPFMQQQQPAAQGHAAYGCVPGFGCANVPGGLRPCGFPNLGVNCELPRKHV